MLGGNNKHSFGLFLLRQQCAFQNHPRGESRIALLSSFGERRTVRSLDLSSACLNTTLSIVILFSLLMMASVAGPIWQIVSLSLPSGFRVGNTFLQHDAGWKVGEDDKDTCTKGILAFLWFVGYSFFFP